MATAVQTYPESNDSITKLTIFNLPQTCAESEVYSMFPGAQYVSLVREQKHGSANVCLVQFTSSYDCQRAYAECRAGKTIEGHRLRAEYGDDSFDSANRPKQSEAQEQRGQSLGNYSNPRQQQHSYPSTDSYNRQSQSQEMRSNHPNQSHQQQHRSQPSSQSGGSFTLTLSNLPYTASEQDIRDEFTDAVQVIIELDERGRSRGVAQLHFSTQEQCNAAHYACNYKQLGGRPIRGRIVRGDRDDDRRDRSSNNSRDHGGREGRYGDYDSSRRDRGSSHTDGGSRFPSRGFGRGRGGGDRGEYGRGGGGGGGFDRDRRSDGRDGGNRFGNNGQRGRDRSPGEPVRGYGSSKSGGPRITSAVIHRPGGDQTSGSSSEED